MASGEKVPKGYWFCCQHKHMNSDSHAPERCSQCSHTRCSHCLGPGKPRPSPFTGVDYHDFSLPTSLHHQFSLHGDSHHHEHDTLSYAPHSFPRHQFNNTPTPYAHYEPLLPFPTPSPYPDPFAPFNPTQVKGEAEGTWICPRCGKVNSAVTPDFCSYPGCEWRKGQDP